MGEYRNAHCDQLTTQLAFGNAPLLVVAVSGRALASSAARAGLSTVVLDCFADRDTRAIASRCAAVARPGTLRLNHRALLQAARRLAPAPASAGLVYGAGLEGRPALLARLSAGRRVFGNPPERLAAVRTPRNFFALLDRLGIPHPPVHYLPPADPTGWITKRAGGAGGAHIRPAARRSTAGDAYFQQVMDGMPASVIFLADGRQALVLGFNQLWTSPARARRPYLYGGAVGGLELPGRLGGHIADRLNALVEATGLVGLNGLDFILKEEGWWVLEINPRPTATMELYDPDYPAGLLALHLAACQGNLPAAAAAPRSARAHAIVHAGEAGVVSESFVFPGWCRDLPMPDTFLNAGDPVCSVFAEAPCPDTARRMVNARAEQVALSLRQGAPVPG